MCIYIYERKYYPGTRNKNDSPPPQLSPILVEKKQSHPSYSRKLRGSTSEGISKDPSARSIRKKSVEYSIPRAISIPSRWFPRRDRVNENIILVVRGLVPCTQYSSHFAFRVLLPSALHPVLPSANYSPSRRRRPKLSSFPLRPPPTPANHHAFPPFSFADSPIFFLLLLFFSEANAKKNRYFRSSSGKKARSVDDDRSEIDSRRGEFARNSWWTVDRRSFN